MRPDLNPNSLTPQTVILKPQLCCMEVRLGLCKSEISLKIEGERMRERGLRGEKRGGGRQ